MSKKYIPYVVIILDGFGIAPKHDGNAVELAKKPVYNSLKKKFAYTELRAHGKYVGLEDDKTSGSEVGHINIGAGRIVEQDALIINQAIRDGSFFKNEAFLGAIEHVKKNKSSLHLMGLMSNNDSPHSNFSHFKSLVKLAKKKDIEKLFIHLFTDGRDSAPKSAKQHLREWGQVLKEFDIGKIASIGGRFYAMDRTKNWERLKIAYNCLVNSKGDKANNAFEAIDQAYSKVNSDEYIPPTVIYEKNKPVANIKDNDAVIFFNLRSDRARQFTKLFVLKNPQEFVRPKPFLKNLFFVTLTGFGPKINVETAFNGEIIPKTLPRLVNKKQLYITETEKFSHVTYFLNGKCPHPVNSESRIMIPSPKTENYAETPHMSASIITDVVVRYIQEESYEFIFINFANPDMLGHTGNIKAAVEGISFLDKCLGKIYKRVCQKGGILFICSDHGNADEMSDRLTGEKITYHTKNKVPLIVSSKRIKELEAGGCLANLAPTILKTLDQPIPQIMDKPLY
ncbi:MAG: 2,3-bisphosphoglycerate-independent phosphoglycerate mutase [Candidatus Moranbacteria bacterium]|nr:2,3-bisphosphoglycerate-independent phosphoglycerate mutase [Candidatus Moranbacteria bacterium]